jgi:hypothetical protein
MAGAVTDKIVDTYNAQNPNVARVTGTRVAAGATLTCDNLAGWPDSSTSAVHFSTYQVDTSGNYVSGTQIDWVGLKTSSTTIGSMTRVAGATDNGNSVGDYVEMNPTATWGHYLYQALTQEHSQADGTHKSTLITSRTEDTTPDVSNDYLLSYDTSATALKKVKPSNLGLTTGWISGALPAVSSVTYNGNRSYDITFASTVASYLSPGMRLRTTRTVAAPTQCTSLNGTTQYYSRASASVAGMTFTDDFTVSAWIKPTSYATSAGIFSRYNGTSGWILYLSSSGQVVIQGNNASLFRSGSTYQSVPLNKWTHVAATLDLSGNVSTIYIDGVSVPVYMSNSGTPSAIVQAGNLEVGSWNGGLVPFPGKIAQASVHSAILTAAQVKAMMSQTIDSSSPSIVAGFTFNNSINDVSANANNLTANGSAVATNADSPFGGQADGTIDANKDYAIVQKVSTTVATVQVPEGCTIPTSGGVTSVDMSAWKVPYNFPSQRGKWRIQALLNVAQAVTSNATYGSFMSGGWQLQVPAGDWNIGWMAGVYNFSTTIVGFNVSPTALTGMTIGAGAQASRLSFAFVSAAASTTTSQVYAESNQNLTALATFTMYTLGATTSAGIDAGNSTSEIFAENAYL